MQHPLRIERSRHIVGIAIRVIRTKRPVERFVFLGAQLEFLRKLLQIRLAHANHREESNLWHDHRDRGEVKVLLQILFPTTVRCHRAKIVLATVELGRQRKCVYVTVDVAREVAVDLVRADVAQRIVGRHEAVIVALGRTGQS